MGRGKQDRAREFFREIQGGELAPMYLFTGSERYLVDRAVEAVTKRLFEDGEIDPFRFEKLHGASTSARDIVSSARTITMFGGSRLIVVQGAHQLSTSDVDTLADYAEKPGKRSHVVLTAEKVDGRRKGWKRIKKAARAVDFKALYQDQMPPWIRRQARLQYKLDLDHEAAEYIAEAVGADMSLADRALEKLRLRVREGGSVSLELAREIVADTRDRSVFELTDALMRRELSASLAALDSLLSQGEAAIKVGFMIARQLRLLMKLKAAQERGVRGRKELSSASGIHGFLIRDYIAGARNFQMDELVALHRLMYQADWRLKSSRLKGDVILEEVVLAICERSERGRPASR